VRADGTTLTSSAVPAAAASLPRAAAGSGDADATSAHFQATVLRVALLLRGVPLLQLVLTGALGGAAPGGGSGLVRVRVQASSDGAELVVRLQGQAHGLAGAFERASGWLADVAGTAEFERALAAESRVLLRAPA
jgi:hypothetical protein